MSYKWSPFYWLAYLFTKMAKALEEVLVDAAEAGSRDAQANRPDKDR